MKSPRPKIKSRQPGKSGNVYWTEDKGLLSKFIPNIDKSKPDTHGPFRSEDEAVDDAIKVLEEQYADKLSRALGDTTIKID
jgi:hypothetical protein